MGTYTVPNGYRYKIHINPLQKQYKPLLFNLTMARLKHQIIDQISGRLGDLVFINRNGNTHIRLYTQPPPPNSEKQLARQSRFGKTMKLINPFRELISFTFGSDPKSFGKALSMSIKKGLCDSNETGYELMSKIPLGTTGMRIPNELKLVQTQPLQLSVSWFKPMNPSPSANDTVSIFLYDPQQNWKKFYPLLGKLTDGGITLDISDISTPLNCFVWVVFRSTHHRHSSDTWLWPELLHLNP